MAKINLDTRTEIHHGITIQDPFAILEDFTPEVEGWISEQNNNTDRTLSQIDLPAVVERSIDAYFNAGELNSPFVRGNRIFQWKRSGEQKRKVLYMRNRGSNEEIPVLDPSAYAADTENPRVSIPSAYVDISEDGKFIAYQISETGDEEYGRLEVKDIDTGELVDQIPGMHRSQVSWLPDNSGFYYTRLEDPSVIGQESEDDEEKARIAQEKTKRYIYFHKTGETDWTHDPEIARSDKWLGLSISDDGSRIFLYKYGGGGANDIATAETSTHPISQQSLDPLFEGQNNVFHPYAKNGYIYARTNVGSPLYKLMRIKQDAPDLTDFSEWETITESPDRLLVSYDIAGDTVIAHYSQSVISELELIDTKTGQMRKVELPTLGTVQSLKVDERANTAFIKFESFGIPPTIFELDIATGTLTKQQQIEYHEPLPETETRLVHYTSDDGTEISMFLVGRKGFEPDGDHQVLMTGYGGFNTNDFSAPRFFGRSSMPALAPWLADGNLVAIPHIRGGGEYGKPWHEAGKKNGRLKTFQDFAAAAKWLTDSNFATVNNIAAWGRSNGGLLIGAMATMYPERFGRLICEVPIVDMINYIKLGGSRTWIPEYGDPDNPEDFEVLRNISPYHNVAEGPLPPILVLSSSDQNVHRAHALKFAARLQLNNTSDNPVLFHLQYGVGHGVDWPKDKLIEKTKRIYRFLYSNSAA